MICYRASKGIMDKIRIKERIKMSKYKQVYNEIKTKISQGVLAPNQELPSEYELMQSI